VSHRSTNPSNLPPGIPCPSFAFFRFFRPHRLFHVLTRSRFAEKNPKGERVGALIRRQSGSGMAIETPPSVACFAALRAAFPVACRKASRHGAKAQRLQPLPAPISVPVHGRPGFIFSSSFVSFGHTAFSKS